MATTIKTPQKLHWSYFNVLEMLMAAMPPGQYTPNFGKWAKVIEDLQEEYESTYPELLGDIYFINLEPLDPYSEELEEFFQRVGATVYNPSFDIMQLTKGKIGKLETRAKKRLPEKYIGIIKTMGKKAASQLKL